jgi:hypothetical protein
MVVAFAVLPHLNRMLDGTDLEGYSQVKEAAAQPGVSLREAVDRSTVLSRVDDQSQVETMRAELDAIPPDVGRTILDAVHEACEADRPVRIVWAEIEPDVAMSAEVAVDPGPDGTTRITVHTPHGRHFEH